MKHTRAFLIQKQWDDITNPAEPFHKIVLGYNTLERAEDYVYLANQDCKYCKQKAALHTRYSVIKYSVPIRIITTNDNQSKV